MIDNRTIVASVDFDAILYPCIKLYNEKVSGSENPTVMWKMLDRDLGIIEHIRYDANLLKNITVFMESCVLNGAKFYPIETHDQIVDILKEKDLENTNSVELLNIDFHHDIIYNKESEDSIISYDEYTCADWVGYMQLKNYLSSYTWIRAANSTLPDPEIIKDFEMDFRMRLNSYIKRFHTDDVDYVFFCLSPQWVPYQYHHLYDLIKETCELIQEKVGDKK